MSLESEAFAPDELSLLDLFGPDASPRAQNIVQSAADRSMDEMAMVINAAGATDSEAENVLNAVVTAPRPEALMKSIEVAKKSIDEFVVTAGTEIDLTSLGVLSSIRHKFEQMFEKPMVVQPSDDGGWTDIDAVWISSLENLTRVEEPKYELYHPAFAADMRYALTAHAKFPVRDMSNIAAKESILAQLAKELTIAMAEGVDLTKINVALNRQNSTTGRIEPINIHAELDVEPIGRKRFSTAGLSGKLIK